LGVPISYEDAAYSYEGDLIDKTDPVYRETHPNGPRALAPKGGALEIRFSVVPSGAGGHLPIPSLTTVLQGTLTQQVAAGIPGEFRVLEIPEQGFAIVPLRVRDTSGNLVPDQSPLETRISFPREERDGIRTLELICGAVTSASGRKVVLGTVPINPLRNQVVRLGASNEVARDLLIRTFDGLRWSDSRNLGQVTRLAWRLLYGPGELTYALNVHQVMMTAKNPDGSLSNKPVTRVRDR
jgi:hypothetical protein